ncbi:MAG: helix-turn-helix transcriptional regulator [Clostridia bacterium]|nr:helix-turn-helix transcriptional regulator [Clostridia bacterium]
MNINTIGATIARLRHERQIKQEELANFVGVSVQAVSKWENGGMPDTDLLPKIADFFHISIDALFARDMIATGSLWNTLFETVHSVPMEERMEKALDICVLLVHALSTDDPNEEAEDFTLDADTNALLFSVRNGRGISTVHKSRNSSYFLHLPPFADTDKALFQNKNYPALFRDLSDEPFFNAVRFLMTRESRRSFTPKLLTRQLGFSEETAENVLNKLLSYHLLEKEIIEMDDEEMVMYKPSYSTGFIAMLNFAKELPHVSSDEPTGNSFEKHVNKDIISD